MPLNPQTIGAISASMSVLLGAFGAHGLKTSLKDDPKAEYYLNIWSTAAQYQMVHSIGMILVPIITKKAGWTFPANQFLAGISLFSGSLYTLVLTKKPLLVAITPLGGVLIATGWLSLAYATKDQY